MTRRIEELNSFVEQLGNVDSISTAIPAITEHPLNQTALLNLCQQLIAEGQQHQNPDWAAQMTAPLSTTSLVGLLTAALHHGNLLSAELYPLLKQIETQLLSWFCSVFKQQYGHFTHGSTYANLEALWQARSHSNSKKVYGSSAVHYSIIKACDILGLDYQPISTDQQDRLILSSLEQACIRQAPAAIILNAGSTAAGNIDLLEQAIHIGHQFHSWCHIDAAWGGAFALLDQFNDHFDVFSQADSLCFDAHKALNQPRPSGLLMYQRSIQGTPFAADYLQSAPQHTLPGSYGGELFIPLWLNLITTGTRQLKQQLLNQLQQAAEFANLLDRHTDWWVLHGDTGIVCFQPSNPDALSTLVEQGMFSTATIGQRKVYRAVFASDHTQATTLFKALTPFL